MKMPFERTSSCWVRYDKYEIREDEKGVRYVTAAEGTKPHVFNPLADSEAMVLEALNVGIRYFNRKIPNSKREAALLDFVHHYGLLGLMTAIPTTPHFVNYEKVYLPKNHFLREEVMETENYLNYFYPFQKLNYLKYKTNFMWEVEGDNDAMALAMTFADDPTAMSMSFQKEYAEPLDWIVKALKDMAFTFLTTKYYYEEPESFTAEGRKLLAQGMAAFGGIAPTYRIALLDKPTIVWDFHSLLLVLQMMFSFMITEDTTPLRICDHCGMIFSAKQKTQRFCCDECRNKGN